MLDIFISYDRAKITINHPSNAPKYQLGTDFMYKTTYQGIFLSSKA